MIESDELIVEFYWHISSFVISVQMFCFTLTNAECKYKLCGIITAPTIPTACNNSFDPQPSHQGMNIPSMTSS